MTITEDDKKEIIKIFEEYATRKAFGELRKSLEETHIRFKTQMDIIPWVALACAGCFAFGIAIGFRVWG